VDLAEVAPPGALVTADEEGRLPVLPALEDVRAPGLLTDRVQPLPLDQCTHLRVLGAHGGPYLDPRWLTLNRRGRVACLDAQQPTALGCDGHTASLAPRQPRPAL